MSDVTAVLLTLGEEATPRALKSISLQTLQPRETVIIRNVRPFYSAFNTGVAKVRTPFFLQVDADMVLDPSCIKDLRNCMTDEVGVVIGQVRDPMVGRVSGIKLFRTKCFETIQFTDSVSPDTDFSDELLKHGWKTVFALKYADSSKERWHTFSEHQPSYTLEYIFRKYLIEGGRHRYRNSVLGLRWQFRQLQKVNHPGSDVARIALGHGIFLGKEEILAVASDCTHDLDCLKAFMGKQGNTRPATGHSLDFLTFTPRHLFKKSYKHAIALRENGSFSAFMNDVNVLGQSRHPFAWIGILGLCRGVFADGFDAGNVRREFQLLDGLLQAFGSKSQSSPRLKLISSKILKNLLAMIGQRPWGQALAMTTFSLYQAARTSQQRVVHSVGRFPKACAWMFSAFNWRVIIPTLNQGHVWALHHLGWWPIQWFPANEGLKRKRPQHMAYLVWNFPKLSETFIQREIQALKGTGSTVEILSESPMDQDYFDARARALAADTQYLLPYSSKKLVRATGYFMMTRPLRFTNLFLFVLFHHYGGRKTLKDDLRVLGLAVYLAGVLREKAVTHIHSPWASKTAFVCMVSARLLQIPYTVQARAYEIHRKELRVGCSEKLDNAQRVITNTRYNEKVLQSIMKKPNWDKIHVIHNGLDLEQFKPIPKVSNLAEGITFLSVARLTEQKGLDYLLKACKILDDRGYSFRCEIIGGTEEPLSMNYYISLKILWHKLGLQQCVSFQGDLPFSEILPKYQQAHIFVLPSVITSDGDRDIIPNVLLEAMAMKLPVVSTPITGIPEIVEDEVSGLLVPARDENALAEAMIRLMEDQELRSQLGENGRTRIEERFDIRKNIQQFCEIYDGVDD